MARFLFCFLLLVSCCYGLNQPSPSLKKKTNICPVTYAMEDFLKKTGLQDSDVTKYAVLFQIHNVDVSELLRMTLPQLQKLGVTSYGDAAKITGTASQDQDQCQKHTLCAHGGVCKDGYQCFSCLCDPESGFYGPLCNIPCLCKNGAQCLTTVTGYKCVCAPGWRGVLCEEQELVTSLQNMVSKQEIEISELKKRLSATENVLEKYKDKLEREWSLVRVDAVFPKLAKFQLHQQTPTYVEKPPVPLTTDTKAIIISVFCNFWNQNGHAYLNFDVSQKGNEKTGKASITNTHFNVYANTFYYEVMIPWDASLGDDITFKLTSTYFTGGANNWYQVKLVGFITA